MSPDHVNRAASRSDGRSGNRLRQMNLIALSLMVFLLAGCDSLTDSTGQFVGTFGVSSY